jgi:SGNH hydrolase-like domain, acetyltransferase AlgX
VKYRAALINSAVVACALVVGLLVAEFAARTALNPADYLSVELQHHDVLGAAPSRHTAGGAFDSWGFRNLLVPDAADIVAIGDSHTYGNTATMSESWPYVLAGITGTRVYNMGLGGYGPNQYTHLLPQALKLKPKLIAVGLYMGDDFENSFLITYGLKHWAALRALPTDQVDFNIWETQQVSPSLSKAIRVWLSRHSVVYQLVFHGPLLGALQGEAQIRMASRLSEAASTLSVPEDGILEAFRPKGLLANLDQASVNVKEGMRISFLLLRQMKELCRQNNTGFIVVVIPTKEMVFADYLERRSDMPLGDVIGRLLTNERLARDQTFDALRQSGIDFVDVLPALRGQRGSQLYARTAGDMHPNSNGYRVIGQAVAAAIRAREGNTR